MLAKFSSLVFRKIISGIPKLELAVKDMSTCSQLHVILSFKIQPKIYYNKTSDALFLSTL